MSSEPMLGMPVFLVIRDILFYIPVWRYSVCGGTRGGYTGTSLLRYTIKYTGINWLSVIYLFI